MLILSDSDISLKDLPFIKDEAISSSLALRIWKGLPFSFVPIWPARIPARFSLMYFLLFITRSIAFFNSDNSEFLVINPMAPAFKNLLAYMFSALMEKISTLREG